MIKKNFIYGIIFVCVSLFVVSCSEVNDDVKDSGFHGNGFVNAESENFHGELIQARNYNTQGCKSCHGFDYSGGTANKSCLTCHNKQDGPENCTTCHGSVNAAPPKDLSDNIDPAVRGVGAHQKHVLGGLLGAAVACTECHQVPQRVTDAGHYDESPFAEVRFDSTSKFFKSDAVYSAENLTCTNTYCHSDSKYGRGNVSVVWTNNSGKAAMCGTCHGVSKSELETLGHPVISVFPDVPATESKTCSDCHGHVVDAGKNIINTALHVNGRVDF